MAKIKRKVEMTLPELIQWGWKNHITEKAFYSNLDGGSVYFDNLQNVSTEHEIAINETFTVEVKEEITEDTIIPLLLKIYKSGDNASEALYIVVYLSIQLRVALEVLLITQSMMVEHLHLFGKMANWQVMSNGKTKS